MPLGQRTETYGLRLAGQFCRLRREGNMVPSHVFPDVVAGDALLRPLPPLRFLWGVRFLDKSFQRFVP